MVLRLLLLLLRLPLPLLLLLLDNCCCAQALSKLAPHIQQVSMESNGKGVDIDGNVLPFEAGAYTHLPPGASCRGL
jgi:hypothetical protein